MLVVKKSNVREICNIAGEKSSIFSAFQEKHGQQIGIKIGVFLVFVCLFIAAVPDSFCKTQKIAWHSYV